jgi:hypothetical protein
VYSKSFGSLQCCSQLAAESADSVAVALAAGSLSSRIGDVQQAEALLRRAYSASKVAVQVSDRALQLVPIKAESVAHPTAPRLI